MFTGKIYVQGFMSVLHEKSRVQAVREKWREGVVANLQKITYWEGKNDIFRGEKLRTE